MNGMESVILPMYRASRTQLVSPSLREGHTDGVGEPRQID